MSNYIDKIQVSGVTYDIQGGGGSVTIDPSLDSGSTNAVANSAITEAVEASGLTVGGFPIGSGLYASKHLGKITMYCKTQYNGSRTERFYCTDGDNTVQCSIPVNYSNFAITSFGTYSGNITPTLSNGEIIIQFTDGWYFDALSSKNDSIGYKYSVTYSGGTASDVIEGSVAEALTDINSKIPSDIVTSVSTNIRTSSKQFVTILTTNEGIITQTPIPLYDGETINYDTNSGGLYVQLKGKTSEYKILSVGNGNYCKLPTASPTYDYAFDKIALMFNTACTRTNTSNIEVYTIDSGMTVYKDVYTYSLTSNTMTYVSGDSMTQYGKVSGNAYWISPKDEYASTIKIQYIRETSCSIAGIYNTNPNNYIIIRVDGKNNTYNAQEVIDDLYDKINDKQDTLSAGTGIEISGNVIYATGGGGTVSSAITSGDTNAVAGGAVYDKFDEVEQVTARALNELNEKINPTVELTQAEYDALVTAGTVSADTFYIITDATEYNLSGKVDTSAFAAYSAATNTALSNKVDKTAVVTAVTSASTDNEIPTAKAVYNAIPTGGSASYSAGRGIDITNNEISVSIPISGASAGSIIQGSGTQANGAYAHAEGQNTRAINAYAHAEGQNTTANTAAHSEGGFTNANGTFSHAEGYYTTANTQGSHAEGYYTQTSNNYEHASGVYNVTSNGSTDADKTLFSVGNGTSNSARHNAFEIRQNGDIYLTYGGTDIMLQNKLAEIEEVIARALNNLNDRITAIENQLNNS